MAKDGGITIEEARGLVADQTLWPRIRDFLWDFAPKVHESWLEGLGEPGFAHDFVKSGVRGPECSPRVKRYVLDSLGVEPCFHTFPKGDGSRLLLLGGETLESIAKWLGALSAADRMRRVTGGAAVRELKALLPGVYPDVFAYTAYFAWKDKGDGKDIGDWNEIEAMGASMIGSALSGIPEPLAARLKFMFPRNLRVSAPPREIGINIINKLLKLRFPEAYSLCC